METLNTTNSSLFSAKVFLAQTRLLRDREESGKLDKSGCGPRSAPAGHDNDCTLCDASTHPSGKTEKSSRWPTSSNKKHKPAHNNLNTVSLSIEHTAPSTGVFLRSDHRKPRSIDKKVDLHNGSLFTIRASTEINRSHHNARSRTFREHHTKQ